MKFLTRLRFDESGMKDLSGMSWENTGVTFDVPGRFGGRAAHFNGASYLKTANNEFNFGTNTDFTVAMWIKYSNAKNYRHQPLLGSYLVNAPGKLGYENCVLYSSVYSNGIPNFSIADVSDDRMVVGSDVTCDNNMWRHLALTRSGNTIMLFVDGKLKDTNKSGVQTNFGVGGSTTIGWLDVRINDTYNYVGTLDDFCIIKDCALWIEDFVPPNTYLSQMSFLYKDTRGQVYGMK